MAVALYRDVAMVTAVALYVGDGKLVVWLCWFSDDYWCYKAKEAPPQAEVVVTPGGFYFWFFKGFFYIGCCWLFKGFCFWMSLAF